MGYYLSRFEAGIEEINERMRNVRVYIEYKGHSDTSSELHEVVIYKNAEGIAVIESDIYDSYDCLDAYMLNNAQHVMKELEVLGHDPDELEDVAKYMLYKKLIEIKEEAEDDELIERIDEELKKIINL